MTRRSRYDGYRARCPVGDVFGRVTEEYVSDVGGIAVSEDQQGAGLYFGQQRLAWGRPDRQWADGQSFARPKLIGDDLCQRRFGGGLHCIGRSNTHHDERNVGNGWVMPRQDHDEGGTMHPGLVCGPPQSPTG